MKPLISISLNPFYYCNFSCSFCYLTTEQLKDKTLLGVDKIGELIELVQERYEIEWVDLYGGELLLLPESYLESLINCLTEKGVGGIGLNTNLSLLSSIVNDERVHVSVSYDFHVREQSERVFENMGKLKNGFSVLLLASPELIKIPAAKIIETLNSVDKLLTVEVKPYSANQANKLSVTFNEYEEFVKSILLCSIPKKFNFTNSDLIDSALKQEQNSFSDDHLYITPKGKFAVLEFDDDDNEFFLEFESIAEYPVWCATEKARVEANLFCGSCKYSGKCLSEHLREVKSLDKGCNGFYHLLNWVDEYKNREYKMNQRIYRMLVTEHEDSFDKVEFIVEEELVDNAIKYFTEATFPLIYPAKSYGAAIVYATLIEKNFGIPLREVLKDPDLFLGEDPFFVPYMDDPSTYEAILEKLNAVDNWMESGWVPYTVKYFNLECTTAGLEHINGANEISLRYGVA